MTTGKMHLDPYVLYIIIFGYVLLLSVIVALLVIVFRYKRKLKNAFRSEITTSTSSTNLQVLGEDSKVIFNFIPKLEHFPSEEFNLDRDEKEDNLSSVNEISVNNSLNENKDTNGLKSTGQVELASNKIRIIRDEIAASLNWLKLQKSQVKLDDSEMQASSTLNLISNVCVSTPDLDIYDTPKEMSNGGKVKLNFKRVHSISNDKALLQNPNNETLNRKSASSVDLRTYDYVPVSIKPSDIKNNRIKKNVAVLDNDSNYLVLLSELKLYQNS